MSAYRLVNRKRNFALCAAMTAICAALTPASAADSVGVASSTDNAPNVLTYNDTFNLEFVSNPQFINDDTVIYSRQSLDIMSDSRQSRLWQVDISSGKHRPFIAQDENISQATLSPDGTAIAYT
jgi:hypothetical protein